MVATQARGWQGGSGLSETVERRTRRDALPEHTQYADTGCDVHPSCLTCPLVRCRYDAPGGVRRLFNEDRDRAIVRAQREGVSLDAIAARFGISRRTVFRTLARERVNLTPGPLSVGTERGRKARGARRPDRGKGC